MGKHRQEGPTQEAAGDPIPLFGVWLQETKQLQEEFFLHHYGVERFEHMTVEQQIAFIKEQFIAVIAEMVELLDETSWKPWASASFVNTELLKKEGIDVLHFVANILCAIGVDDRELSSDYLGKMEVNRQRQLNMYSGLEKCVICKRSIEDLQVAGSKDFEFLPGEPLKLYINEPGKPGDPWVCPTCAKGSVTVNGKEGS